MHQETYLVYVEVFQEEKRLMSDEGFHSTPYTDTADVCTFGYGTNLDVGITPEEALLLLRFRANRARKDAVRLCKHFGFNYLCLPLDVACVLVNFVYNVGYTGAKGFRRMFAALAIQDYERAAVELLDSAYADQVGKRAQRLAIRIDSHHDPRVAGTSLKSPV